VWLAVQKKWESCYPIIYGHEIGLDSEQEMGRRWRSLRRRDLHTIEGLWR